MPTSQIEYQSPKNLTTNQRNARTHSKKQIAQIAASISEFGFTNPILVDAQGQIVAGHGRIEAAKSLDIDTVPTICLDHLSAEQIRAYVIADNRLAELAGWDDDILAIEFAELEALDLEFDLDITGFEMADIDLLIEASQAEPDPADYCPDLPSEPVTKTGDVWIIGKHRLICGDAKDQDVYARLLGNQKAQMVFTDPPYNVPIDGHVSGLGKNRHREFAEASGEMSSDEFAEFLTTVSQNLGQYSQEGSLHYICMDWRHLAEMQIAGSEAYSELKNLIIWNKTNAGMGSFYRSKHELIFLFKNGEKPHINNVQLGKHGRYRTNVWDYAGANAFGGSRDNDLAIHPTVKPVALVAEAIRDASHVGQIVLDAFAGSGSTLLAAHRTRRRGFGIEIDPVYCDVTLQRMSDYVGAEPVLEATGQTFAQVGTERAASQLCSDDLEAAQ